MTDPAPFPAAAPNPLILAQELERLVSAHREWVGVCPLHHSATLAAAARQHAQRMRNLGFFAHRDPHDLSTPADRVLCIAPGQWSLIAENLAAGQLHAEEIFLAWLGSLEHRANLEHPGVSYIGTSVETHGAYATYTAQLYGRT